MEAEENMQEADWGRKCESWSLREDAFCLLKWIVGINQIVMKLK